MANPGLGGHQHIVRLPEIVFDDSCGPVQQLRRDEADGKRIALNVMVGASVADALLAPHVLDLFEFVGPCKNEDGRPRALRAR